MKNITKTVLTFGTMWLWTMLWFGPIYGLAYVTAQPYFNKTAKYVVPLLTKIASM